MGDVRSIDVDTQPALERAEAMLRVFGDDLGDEPGGGPDSDRPEAIETFAPSWVRAAKPYDEASLRRRRAQARRAHDVEREPVSARARA